MVYAIIIIIVLILGVFLYVEISKNVKNIQQVDDKLKSLPGFNSEKLLLKSQDGRLKGLSIDSVNRKICFIDGTNLIVKPFRDVLEAELKIDGSTITKTSRGSQVLGVAVGSTLGAIFGGAGVGAMIGGLSGSTQSIDKIKTISLQILVNDLTNPVHEITLTNLTAIKTALDEAKEWNGIFKVILFQGEEDRRQ
jgi:hypothetical protein